ncbi:dienelactone hydrolase family protein [Paenibacillus planticolens]|uniref:Dienelactone hydrolase family protein n=1 Tax=Paenibacillus planticolens TaxID=2654976 RepID=A0ABX1ZLU3_9BACL|nr:dienelactone hydrolase family protein [Paenibacillus planticolens]NOV00658.1 dienelactone hydrolase family protein [Paenibacillus planticolens]
MDMSTPNSDMLVIVLHDIHGITPFFQKTCERIQSTGADVLCPDLYTLVNPYAYNRGSNPHTYFLNNIGFEGPKERIIDIVRSYRSSYKRIVILGFSVGATIAWLCSGESLVDGVVGLYGSRIRNYMHIQPRCPVLLLFALSEQAYHPPDLQKPLEEKGEHVQTQWYYAAHGFADPQSESFCPKSADTAWEEIVSFLRKTEFGEKLRSNTSITTNSV